MKVLLPALLVFMLFSCSTKNEKNPTVAPPTSPNSTCISFPLAPENYWVFNKVEFYPDKSVEKKWVDTVRSNRTFVQNGNTYYSFGAFYFRNKDCNTIVSLENSSTLAEIEVKNNVTEDTKIFDLPYSKDPCKVGLQVWSYKDRIRINNYDCFKASYKLTSCQGQELAKVYVYIAEGVGIVKLAEFNLKNGKPELKYVWELASYKTSPLK